MNKVFYQIGYIINEYVPELYKFELFEKNHILSIHMNNVESSTHGFDFKNLNRLVVTSDCFHFTSNFINISKLQYVSIENFSGNNLLPLTGAPLLALKLGEFRGDLTPLQGAPLISINLGSFNGDLTPLKGAPLRSIKMDYFKGNLTPLKGAPLELIHMQRFNGDLSPLKGAPLKNVFMPIYYGDLSPFGNPLPQKLNIGTLIIGSQIINRINFDIIDDDYLRHSGTITNSKFYDYEKSLPNCGRILDPKMGSCR